jgi:hypothetical protein
MNLSKLARISVLCLIALITVLAVPAQAAPKCGCALCTQDPERTCNLDGQTTTCGYFLAVALCPAGATNSPADSMSRADGSFLTLTSEIVQEPSGCMVSGN